MRHTVPVLVSALLLMGCSALSVFDGPSRNHVSVANGAAFQVAMADGDTRLVASLDTQSSVESRFLQAITVGKADEVPASQYESAAKEWLRMERPECSIGGGRRVSFGVFSFDLTCPAREPADRPRQPG